MTTICKNWALFNVCDEQGWVGHDSDWHLDSVLAGTGERLDAKILLNYKKRYSSSLSLKVSHFGIERRNFGQLGQASYPVVLCVRIGTQKKPLQTKAFH